MLPAEKALGIVQPDLKHCRIRSPAELEASKRKVKSVAVNTALCVVCLGVENLIPADVSVFAVPHMVLFFALYLNGHMIRFKCIIILILGVSHVTY